MKPFAHQEKFIKGYKGPRLLVHETGTGKTVCAALWLRDGRDSNALIICPKKVMRKWKQALDDWGTTATIVSKEDFKKAPIGEWSALVVDEADEFASPLFIASKRSQLSASLYEQVQKYPKMPVMLLTATPIRSNPWNLHTLLCYIGEYIDWKKWRNEFFELKYMPYLPRPAYMPKPDWRKRVRPYLEKYGDIVLMKDCVGELPPVTEEEIKVPTKTFVKNIETKPFFDEHRWEQQNKAKEIMAIGKDCRKVLVVAYYREQIQALQLALSKERETFAIHGGVGAHEAVIEKAQASDECYFIVQADIGAGFDLDTFSCAVFASMSYGVRSWVQMCGRIRRRHNLHPVKRIYLIGGQCDRAVLKNVRAGKDFVPATWNENEDA